MKPRQKHDLSRLCPDICWDVPMGHYSTLKAGGVAAALVTLRTEKDLLALLHWLGSEGEGLPWMALGGGSNLLVVTEYFDGIFLRLRGDFRQQPAVFEENPETETIEVTVGAGYSLPGLVAWCAKEGYSGLECLAGIPGSVGGAVRMNAGAFGGSIGQVVKKICCFSVDKGKVDVFSSDICFSYRRTGINGFKDFPLLGQITCMLRRKEQRHVQATCQDFMQRRKGGQPQGVASAGSFFKNPTQGKAAGFLIEQAGFKGVREGDAMVSPVHANFLVNLGAASPGDFLRLMKKIQDKVYKETAILLEPEVVLV